jgi:archaellum component FlaC
MHSHTHTLAHIHTQLEIVQESNKTLSVDLSTLADSCDQLTSELVTCREEVEYWEKKYKDKDKEVTNCDTMCSI